MEPATCRAAHHLTTLVRMSHKYLVLYYFYFVHKTEVLATVTTMHSGFNKSGLLRGRDRGLLKSNFFRRGKHSIFVKTNTSHTKQQQHATVDRIYHTTTTTTTTTTTATTAGVTTTSGTSNGSVGVRWRR